MIRMLLTETMPNIPTLQFKPIDPNQIARYVVNTLIGLALLVGVVIGGIQLAHGLPRSGDPSDKYQGLYTILGSIIVAGLVYALVNMIIL